ncbi:hypothetical protein RJ639_025111 [Escallonia herrerae]|uniref:Uncharacterized protein n=1 Tax=Escallonia herrerae TaxID=1293975 RepID=A0AA88UYB3_9ASTE|nr:hypothetical protein RJ639_025111 [Escallonia herrerae]
MVCWLEIHGKINARMLSPNTTYGAYLVVKFAERAFGLDSLPSDVSVEVGDKQSRGTIYLRHKECREKAVTREQMMDGWRSNWVHFTTTEVRKRTDRVLQNARWMQQHPETIFDIHEPSLSDHPMEFQSRILANQNLGAIVHKERQLQPQYYHLVKAEEAFFYQNPESRTSS